MKYKVSVVYSMQMSTYIMCSKYNNKNGSFLKDLPFCGLLIVASAYISSLFLHTLYVDSIRLLRTEIKQTLSPSSNHYDKDRVQNILLPPWAGCIKK